jgi:hypothetical protein
MAAKQWLRRLWLCVADLAGKSCFLTSSEQSPFFSDYKCLPLFNFVKAGILTTAENLS